MANVAIFASGNGSNYEVLANEINKTANHKVVLLICDRQKAFVRERAQKIGTPCELINYVKNSISDVEKRIFSLLRQYNVDIVFLAGFMRIFSADFITECDIPIVNIHPSLLPKYKGAHAIEAGFNSDDAEIGITIHYINEDVDSGEIILQKSIPLIKNDGFDKVESAIHELEYKYYPQVAIELCNKI